MVYLVYMVHLVYLVLLVYLVRPANSLVLQVTTRLLLASSPVLPWIAAIYTTRSDLVHHRPLHPGVSLYHGPVSCTSLSRRDKAAVPLCETEAQMEAVLKVRLHYTRHQTFRKVFALHACEFEQREILVSEIQILSVNITRK